ncbi:Aldo/keto reductase [Lentinus tigrinus ALCF2SS1-7]|uniref:Aldo/keto reductase n=1 Tax=Lentinus tigrinus ALCF2SS1-6 TaxID=1328759 RepID=A0A5C2RLE8_9APHY|nr:Aldo/keto reductase [Lentinus tigrinus ALCF2SS1-6]RPD67923.1 Aldo/keto reductase [Lentinus tigrinus ALCF2SS1-7]
MSTPTRKIGDYVVYPIGYGAMGIAGVYTSKFSDDERLKVLDAVYDNGCTHWDTADVYGDSEYIIGKWLKKTGKRNEIFLATKFGMIRGQPLPDGRHESLAKLGVDYVDLWYYHRTDRTVPIDLTVAAMAEQVKLGKVKFLGLSEVSADTLRRAHAVHPITALQVEYSSFTLDIEDPKTALLQTARELGVKIVCYSPVGRGLLTGKICNNFPNIINVVNSIKTIADKHGATPRQVTLAWILAQGDDFFPIPGSTKVANIKENMDAQNVKLTPEEVTEIREIAVAADATTGIGPRYPPAFAALVMADTPPLK